MTDVSADDAGGTPLGVPLGPLAGRYSTADDGLPWWMTAPAVAAGFAVLVLGGDHGWAHALGMLLIIGGSVLLGQRYGLRATSEVSAHGLRLEGYYGRRVDLVWSDVAEVLPARTSSGRSRVRLTDGRTVLLGGVPVEKARRLSELRGRAAESP